MKKLNKESAAVVMGLILMGLGMHIAYGVYVDDSIVDTANNPGDKFMVVFLYLAVSVAGLTNSITAFKSSRKNN